MNESLIVINTLAVKRSELRGGLWSTAGKRVEKPLMQTLCHLHKVAKENYSLRINNKEISNIDFQREVDFYLKSKRKLYKCEVKLMGRGNPESADAVIARDSEVFISDKLSETNKTQLDSLNIRWVELRSNNGFRKFANVLKELGIPYQEPEISTDTILDDIFEKIFHNNNAPFHS